jgi:multidrug resistance protein, MATE family
MKDTAPQHRPRAAVTHREILAIAVPVMISNVSVPLLGLVDTAVIGRLPDPAYLAGVALGALLFSFLFWGFGFLRMGTTGLTAQALGARDGPEIRAALGRALLIAVVVGAALIALQLPIREAAFGVLQGSEKVERLARDYFGIRIWAAPATLANYALLGWFIGLGQARVALILQLVLNLTNMALDALFVLTLGMGVAGVAAGTLIAETFAALFGAWLAVRHLRGIPGAWSVARLLDPPRLARTITVNRDIMIRSAALIFVVVWFMAHAARAGDVTLAANAMLMHFVGLAAYFLDGVAFSAEALVGRAVGAGDRASLSAAARLSTYWAGGLALAASSLFALCGPGFIDLLSVDAGVRASAREYLPWAALVPVIGVWCFQLDGIFIGATRTADMRNAMLVSVCIFLAAWALLTPFGNHGLWAALCVNYAARALTLFYHVPALARSVGS